MTDFPHHGNRARYCTPVGPHRGRINKLENVAINDELPLKAARSYAIANANLQFLGPWDTSDLISMASFTFTMRRHLIVLAT